MGNCCSPKLESPEFIFSAPEEKLIETCISKIPFFECKLRNIEKCLSNHHFDHKLNKSDLRKVFADLGLKFDDLSDPSSSLFKFFEAFLDSDRLYTQRKIVLSSALASKESKAEKIGIIGKYYDFSQNNALEIDEIQQLLEEIVEVSVVIIPKIALAEDDETDKNGKLSGEEYKTYTQKLLAKRTSFVNNYSVKIMTGHDSLSFNDVCNKFKDPVLEKLLSSHQVREILAEIR